MTISAEERALLNEETMSGARDRSFCGVELEPITLDNRRYVERMLQKLSKAGYSSREVTLAYAYLLTIPLPHLRKVARDMDLFDEGLDEFLKKTLPDPQPAAEIEKLAKIVDDDIREIQAAFVEVQPKPSAKDPLEVESPNS